MARELTKVHQSLIRGTAHDICQHLQHVRGEVTVVVGPATGDVVLNDQLPMDVTATSAVAYFGQLADSGTASRRQAVSLTARRFGLSAKTVYRAVEQAKRSAK
jgi:16S rRNA C1402 (ribose-2'-O) methylase RsmI